MERPREKPRPQEPKGVFGFLSRLQLLPLLFLRSNLGLELGVPPISLHASRTGLWNRFRHDGRNLPQSPQVLQDQFLAREGLQSKLSVCGRAESELPRLPMTVPHTKPCEFRAVQVGGNIGYTHCLRLPGGL